MTVSPSGKDAYLFHPGGDAKTECKSAMDTVGMAQRKFNFSSSSVATVVVVVIVVVAAGVVVG
jgi:hypothetical protein